MNNKLRNVLKKRYEAEIEDAKYKLELHGYYFDGKKSWIMYIDKDGKIIMKEDKWTTDLKKF